MSFDQVLNARDNSGLSDTEFFQRLNALVNFFDLCDDLSRKEVLEWSLDCIDK